MRFPLIPALLATLFVHSAAVSDKQQKTRNQPQISVGYFKIPIHDDLFNETAIALNDTLIRNFTNFWWDELDYYTDEFNDSLKLQQDTAISNARYWLDEATTFQWTKYLNETAMDWWQNKRCSFGFCPSDFDDPGEMDYTSYYLDVLANLTTQTRYYRLGAFSGVGWSSSCSQQVGEVLENMPEWNKAGSTAAITVMALLPTFLAFGNLYVPRSSEAFATSLLVGLSCALYSFGLPVKSISAIRDRNHINISDFTLAVRNRIGKFGRKQLSSLNSPQNQDKSKPQQKFDIEELQTWTKMPDDYDGSVMTRGNPAWDGPTEEAKQHFGQIRAEVENWKKRRHWWHIPAIFVAAAQISMFAVAIAPLLFTLGAPRFLLDCNSNWTAYYLAVSAIVNAVIRLLMWESGYHERVKIYALSRSASKTLSRLVERTEGLAFPRSTNTAVELPPLYPPLLERFMYYYHGMKHTIRHLFGSSQTPEKDTLVHDVKHATRAVRGKWAGRAAFASKNPRKVLWGGFGGLKENISARRWRPVVVLIHLAAEGRNKLYTLFTGFVEAMLLLILTFFFAAHWGGNLYVTGIALVLLLIFVTAGRALGVIYVMISSYVWGLHVVHCGSHDEILGTLRIICSMKDVLVVVNGATYFNGYKLDGRPEVAGEPGFDEWMNQYEKGEYDHDEETQIIQANAKHDPDDEEANHSIATQRSPTSASISTAEASQPTARAEQTPQESNATNNETGRPNVSNPT